MKISVVIPCFNAAVFLPRAVESVLYQRVSQTEIVVVDDGSTDDTLAVASRLSRQVENVRIIRRALNEGVSRVRNIGLRQAQGPLRLFPRRG